MPKGSITKKIGDILDRNVQVKPVEFSEVISGKNGGQFVIKDGKIPGVVDSLKASSLVTGIISQIKGPGVQGNLGSLNDNAQNILVGFLKSKIDVASASKNVKAEYPFTMNISRGSEEGKSSTVIRIGDQEISIYVNYGGFVSAYVTMQSDEHKDYPTKIEEALNMGKKGEFFSTLEINSREDGSYVVEQYGVSANFDKKNDKMIFTSGGSVTRYSNSGEPTQIPNLNSATFEMKKENGQFVPNLQDEKAIFKFETEKKEWEQAHEGQTYSPTCGRFATDYCLSNAIEGHENRLYYALRNFEQALCLKEKETVSGVNALSYISSGLDTKQYTLTDYALNADSSRDLAVALFGTNKINNSEFGNQIASAYSGVLNLVRSQGNIAQATFTVAQTKGSYSVRNVDAALPLSDSRGNSLVVEASCGKNNFNYWLNYQNTENEPLDIADILRINSIKSSGGCVYGEGEINEDGGIVSLRSSQAMCGSVDGETRNFKCLASKSVVDESGEEIESRSAEETGNIPVKLDDKKLEDELGDLYQKALDALVAPQQDNSGNIEEGEAQ